MRAHCLFSLLSLDVNMALLHGPLASELRLLVFLDRKLACSCLPPMMLPWNSLGFVSELVTTLLTPTGPMVEPAAEFAPSFWILIAGGTYPTSDIL